MDTKIVGKTEFSAYDEVEEFAIYAVDFIKENRMIAYIVSHYRAYGSEFGWVREIIIE